ncbi:PepSY-associated TM helix domain-containing protein [Pedomonas sp. V897]|uniref:PepSY-associated TM helix domain-containing protein n=1 Tax=Pedomonas sp. V897 TaxID=3446482 RepID=UPI003EE1ABC3
MKAIDLLHRWTGGLIGLLLAVLGLSGAILVHKDAWVLLPHADDPQVQEVSVLADTVTRLMTGPERPQSILLSTRNFGLHRLGFGGEAGAYANQAGEIVTRWDSKWDRVELWLFDLHHYLWSGEVGSVVAGCLGLVGLGFVVTGVVLWWRTRKTFEFRLWPARMSRPAIMRQHRDIGVIVAPLLFLSLLTGVMLTLRPVANLLLSPLSGGQDFRAAMAPPEIKGGALNPQLNWATVLGEAHRRFPEAEFRSLRLPGKPGDLISLRMKQPEEWLPNGRTLLWFDPADGRLVEARDALAMPAATQVFNAAYPLHAAKVGGIAYRVVMTLSGLGLGLLGTLSVWTFWFRRPKPRARPAVRVSSART